MIIKATIICAALMLVTGEKYTNVVSKLDQVVYIYPNNIRKDKDLDTCQPDSVCGVINQRFWLPSFSHRFCQCPKSTCPFSWSKNDSRSVTLDNRSQLKTCEDTRNLMVCDKTTVGLMVTESLDHKTGKHKKDVRILCYCQGPSYWKLDLREANSTVTYSEYTCSQLEKCKSLQFCGHVRADTFSTYYRCACPSDHLCINKDKIQRNATELLYNGQMLRAYCVPKYNTYDLNKV